MATDLERATYRVITSLRRRAAGEHVVPAGELVYAFASEWMLTAAERRELVKSARRERERLRELKATRRSP